MDSKVERGRYLLDLMGCQECHSPREAVDALSGGVEILIKAFRKPFRGPNISQDRRTGIGLWTDEQIVAAIREGKRPDQRRLSIVHPYPQYAVLSDDDAAALVAYLRTVPPVERDVPRTEGPNLKSVNGHRPTGKAPDPADRVAYGGYLASLMTCGQCHTPFDEGTGAFDASRVFAGGFRFEFSGSKAGFNAGNLTPDPTGLAAYSEADLVKVIREMKKPDGTLIKGPMALRLRGWYRITEPDAKAVATFLKSLKPIKHVVPKSDG